jgi:hypothetical protein
MAAAERLARNSRTTVIGRDSRGTYTLAQALNGDSTRRWNYVSYPRIYGQDVEPGIATVRARKALLKRVMKAVNDYQPVVMSVMIDFNAMDVSDNGSFKKSLLDEMGSPGRQGGHMLVLEDYTVTNVPGYGELGEGDLSPEMKAAAPQGDLKYLVTKNSWGKNRPERGLTDGYTRFYEDYLNGQIAWKNSEDSADDDVSYYTTLSAFILPPGY